MWYGVVGMFGIECSYCCKHLVSEKETSLANLAASMFQVVALQRICYCAAAVVVSCIGLPCYSFGGVLLG